MSNQIVISSGAKVRSLEGVLTGTAGIVSSVPLGAANGVATLDSSGKVPLSQLPASVVTYLGTWNAATNTPTLANGTGDVGDLYICNVAGTVNFGAGPITFAVGDWVIYSGTEWQKSSGATGTVTSVAVTESGDALTITGSPITTAGTINIGFAGNSTQYINGEGNLVTFPTLITEAQNLITDVYNETGATLTKGTVVYINGGHGNLPTVTKALATSDATSAQTYGVVQADITNNNNGHVVVIGSLGDLDTQAYAAGTQLYLSSTTAGAWTSVKQYAPAHLVYVGIVVRSHPTQGVVEIKIQNGFELDELHNVSAQTPSNNDGLFYNSSNSLWENKSIATALGYTPANAATYVPYTGATSSVSLGSYQLTASKLTASNGGNGNVVTDYLSASKGIFLTDTLSGGQWASGITNIVARTAGLLITHDGGGGILNFNTSATYTYIFPAANGTIALTSDIPSLTNYVTLNGAQTITGIKTFTNEQLFGNGITLTGGYITYTSGSYNLTLNTNILTANRNVFLQDKAGTIALTSDIPSLSGYVPYTGATTNVDLGANNLTSQHLIANGLSGVSGTLQLKQNTSFAYSNGYTSFYTTGNNFAVTAVNSTGTSLYNAIFDLSASTSSRTFTLPTTSGTIALLSDIPSLSGYVQGSGTTNYHAKFTAGSTIGNSMLTDDGTTLQSIGATRSNLYLKAASNSYYSQLAFTNGTNGSFGGISYNNSGQYMQFETNSSEWMRLTSDGKLGIGTTSPSAILDIVGTFRTRRPADTTQYIDIYPSGGEGFIDAVNSAAGTSQALVFRNGNSGGTTERMRITSTGNVGIGTSSPYSKLGVGSSTSTNGEIGLVPDFEGAGEHALISYLSGTGYKNLNIEAGQIRFWTGTSSTTERMRITSSGDLCVGTSSAINSGKISISAALYTASTGISIQNTQTIYGSSTSFVVFVNSGGAAAGNIYQSAGTTVNYNTSSDARLKEDIGIATDTSVIDNTIIHDFTWKADKRIDRGVFAQEAYKVKPSAVGIGKDDLTQEGELVQPWSVDYSKYVPDLIVHAQQLKKQVQEQGQIIKELQAKIVTLESKIN